MPKSILFIVYISLVPLCFGRSETEVISPLAAAPAVKLSPQIDLNRSSDLATSLTERPDTQLIQKTFEKLSEINPNFFKEKRETAQLYIKENAFFQTRPYLQKAALSYMDAFYYGTQILKYEAEAGAKLFIPCVLMGVHLATGDIPLAVTTGVSLGVNVLNLIPDAIENWKNIGKMSTAAIKTIGNLTKSVFSAFKK